MKKFVGALFYYIKRAKKMPGGGRPKKNNKGYKIESIRMTADEYEEYKELVELNGGASSDFLRRSIGILRQVLKKGFVYLSSKPLIFPGGIVSNFESHIKHLQN